MEVITGGKTKKSNKKKVDKPTHTTITYNEETDACNVSYWGNAIQIENMATAMVETLFQDKHFLGDNPEDAKALFIARLIALEGISFDGIVSNYTLIVRSVLDDIESE